MNPSSLHCCVNNKNPINIQALDTTLLTVQTMPPKKHATRKNMFINVHYCE